MECGALCGKWILFFDAYCVKCVCVSCVYVYFALWCGLCSETAGIGFAADFLEVFGGLRSRCIGSAVLYVYIWNMFMICSFCRSGSECARGGDLVMMRSICF